MKHFKDTKEYKPANAVTAASLGSMCSLITRKTCESTTCALLKAAPESKNQKHPRFSLFVSRKRYQHKWVNMKHTFESAGEQGPQPLRVTWGTGPTWTHRPGLGGPGGPHVS